MVEGIVKIHGKEYQTVAYRVAKFREDHTVDSWWGIVTELVEANDKLVVMKASIMSPEGVVVGTGYSEERRDASKINKTSAMENAETSAIGRALAACGRGGVEYASANEMQSAIKQQGGDAEEPDDRGWIDKASKAIDKRIFDLTELVGRDEAKIRFNRLLSSQFYVDSWKKLNSVNAKQFITELDLMIEAIKKEIK